MLSKNLFMTVPKKADCDIQGRAEEEEATERYH